MITPVVIALTKALGHGYRNIFGTESQICRGISFVRLVGQLDPQCVPLAIELRGFESDGVAKM
jgi:hypothetical protein